jgi:hypothetical protein
MKVQVIWENAIPIIYEGMVLEDAFRADLHCFAPLRLCARNP